ncbi:ribbon-helix-helix protein, CopG family [Plantibacter sp. YIM 135347]|uniref:ribbon-helix-helix protein, CopG family n=1 Tax=Plantibacter sp. YIM 135347 TaxID=3423919 RepID=UPI003D345427
MTEKHWNEAAQWAEGLDALGPDVSVTRGSAESHAEVRDLLEGALGGPDALQRAVRGRPSVGHDRAAGASPIRRVRLTREMDEALQRRAEREHRKPSEVMREALAAYLQAS